MDDNFWRTLTAHRVGRRAMLRGSAVAGAGLAASALIGCGGGTKATTTPTTSAAAKGTAAATGTAAAAVKRGGTYKTWVNGDPPSIDLNATPSFAARGFAAFVYSRLYRIDTAPGANPWDRPPTGDLAESAETTDGITWTVKLRKGVKFQNIDPVNGRELTAQDVLFSWGKLTGPKSTLAAGVKNITGVTAIDDHTLQFKHDAPNADFLEQLADGFLLWITPTESDGKFDAAKKAIGTGPWIMDSYQVSQRFVFKKNPDYFVPGVPYMDGVTQAIIPEYANQMSQFQGGNVFNVTPTADDVLGLRSQFPKAGWLASPGIVDYGLFFSPEDQDPQAPWRDDRFRIAASYSVDRASLQELLYNVKKLQAAGLTVTTDWNNQVAVGMGKLWWLDPKSADQGRSAAYFNYNPAEAKKLLDAVGVPQGTKITYQYTNNRYGAAFNSAAEAIQGTLSSAGFPITTETQDYSSKFITQTWQGRFHGIALGDFGGFSSLSGYLGEEIDDNPENRRLLHTQDMLDLKKKQSQEIDINKRSSLVHDLQRTNDEHMYIVPTTGGGGTGYTAYQPQVQGIRLTRGLAGPTEQLAYYWLSA